MVYLEMLRLDADVLLRETNELTKQERWVTARLLVRLAAVETRELYAPCGYASMWEYCLGELGMSEDAAGRGSGRRASAGSSQRCSMRWRTTAST